MFNNLLPSDSELTFFDAASGSLNSNFTATGLKHIATGYGLSDYVSSTRCKYDATYSGFSNAPNIIAINNSGESYICSIKYGNTPTAATIYIYIDDPQGRFSPTIRAWVTWIAIETY